MAVVVRKRDVLAERSRTGIFLTGNYDNSNRIFDLPGGDAAVHDPPRRILKVIHGGRRLQYPLEYDVEESFPGSGINRVRTKFAPQPESRLYADYVAAS